MPTNNNNTKQRRTHTRVDDSKRGVKAWKARMHVRKIKLAAVEPLDRRNMASLMSKEFPTTLVVFWLSKKPPGRMT